MPIKILFDNNALASFHGLADEQRILVVRALTDGDLVLHGTEELLDELVAMYQSGSRPNLPPRAHLLLNTMRGAPYRYYKDIVASELEGELNVHRDLTPVQTFLAAVVDGRVSHDVLDTVASSIRAEKERHAEFYAEQQREVRDVRRRKRELRLPKLRAVTVERIDGGYWERWEPEYLERFYRESGATDPAAQTAHVIEHPESFPFLQLLKRVNSAVWHHTMNDDRAVTEGIVYDAGQLVYLHDADVLVTDDKWLQDLFPKVFGHASPKRVVSFRTFLNDIGLHEPAESN